MINTIKYRYGAGRQCFVITDHILGHDSSEKFIYTNEGDEADDHDDDDGDYGDDDGECGN